MNEPWELFYNQHKKPTDYNGKVKLMSQFIQSHLNEKIVLITSGGTTVPMEHNTVRFVDNFSAGTRGSASVEYFLQNGYSVIFLYRLKSLEPFTRHFTGFKMLNALQITEKDGDNEILVKPEHKNHLLSLLRQYQKVVTENRLLCVSFETLADYLWYLRGSCECLSHIKRNCLLYLAAAVSDFYIPPEKMPEHKIQSSMGLPTISLQLVPKILQPLTSYWLPEAFIVSFKLETDEQLLIKKAREALNKYKHKLVIGNMLHTRKQRVVIVSVDDEQEIKITDEEIKNGIEIEKYIVRDIAERHAEFILGVK